MRAKVKVRPSFQVLEGMTLPSAMPLAPAVSGPAETFHAHSGTRPAFHAVETSAVVDMELDRFHIAGMEREHAAIATNAGTTAATSRLAARRAALHDRLVARREAMLERREARLAAREALLEARTARPAAVINHTGNSTNTTGVVPVMVVGEAARAVEPNASLYGLYVNRPAPGSPNAEEIGLANVTTLGTGGKLAARRV